MSVRNLLTGTPNKFTILGNYGMYVLLFIGFSIAQAGTSPCTAATVDMAVSADENRTNSNKPCFFSIVIMLYCISVASDAYDGPAGFVLFGLLHIYLLVGTSYYNDYE